MKFSGFSEEQARDFAAKWHPAWTGNQPELLLSFYSEDAIYMDGGLIKPLKGHEEIRPHFEKLLSQNPNWVWRQRYTIPMQDGFVNHWHVSAPVGDKTVEIDGVCLVHLRDGKIYRNEVYFDRHELVSEILSYQSREQA